MGRGITLAENLTRISGVLRATSGRAAGYDDINRAVRIPPGTFHRLMRTMIAIGWVRRVGHGRYVSARNGEFPEYPKLCQRCGTTMYSKEHDDAHMARTTAGACARGR